MSELAHCPKNALALSPVKTWLVKSLCFAAKQLGFWNRPARGDGRFETMSLLDKIHWLAKSETPILSPEADSGIDQYFKEHKPSLPGFPDSFVQTDSVNLSFAGDLMQNNYSANSKETLYTETTDILFDTDLSMANLEAPLTSQPNKGFAFRENEAPSTYISEDQFDVLKGPEGKNFSVLNTANNHTFDYGMEGVLTTLDKLAEHKIVAVGTYRSKAEQQATIIEMNSMKIGVIAATFGLNGKSVPQGSEYCVTVAPLNSHQDANLPEITAQLAYCAQQECDLVIACLHWGREYEFYPAPSQIALAHALADAGVDLIIGHHPHMVQPAELYEPQGNGSKRAFICYSLGNLVNPFSSPYLTLSLIANLTIAKGHQHGKVVCYLDQVKLTPVCQTVDTSSTLPTLQLEKYSPNKHVLPPPFKTLIDSHFLDFNCTTN